MAKKIAIMQPTYIPWLGYFGLMAAVDEFVVLDDVQFERRSWQQRNRIKGPEGAVMLTIPVFSKGKREQNINEVEIDRTSGFAQKHARSLELAYRRAPFWAEYGPGIQEAVGRDEALLAAFTISLLERLRDLLGLRTPLIRSSSLEADGKREHRLISICRARGADIYVSPPGSYSYLKESQAFSDARIELLYNDYAHPVYPQLHGEFISHLSVIDLLLNCGARSGEIVAGGINLTPAAAFEAKAATA